MITLFGEAVEETKPWWDSRLLTALIAVVVTASLTWVVARLVAWRAYSEKLWDRRADAYKELIERTWDAVRLEVKSRYGLINDIEKLSKGFELDEAMRRSQLATWLFCGPLVEDSVNRLLEVRDWHASKAGCLSDEELVSFTNCLAGLMDACRNELFATRLDKKSRDLLSGSNSRLLSLVEAISSSTKRSDPDL